MALLLNRFYGIVYRNANGSTTVFNGRVVSRGAVFFVIRFMDSRGFVVLRRLLLARVIRAVLI